MAETPKREWKSGLFDCFEDANTCCYGFWCCPCLACTVSGRFKENYCLPLCDIMSALTAFCGISVYIPPAAVSLRASIRNKYNIKGSICGDMVASCCCASCVWCQMHREIKDLTPVVVVAQQPQAPQTTVINVQANPVMNVNQNSAPPNVGFPNPAQSPPWFSNP